MSRQRIDLRGPIGPSSAPVVGRVTAASPEDFFGEGRRVDLDDVSVVEVRLAPSRYEATPETPDVIDVVVPVSGTMRASGLGGHRDVPPGSLVFSRPTRGDVRVVHVESVLLRATFPCAALRASVLPMQDLPAVAVRREHAAAFTALLRAILDAPRSYRSTTAAALRDAVVEMAEAILFDSTEPRRATRTGSLVARAEEHIDAVLTDPRTSPREVAAALGVSLRALHLAFEGEELSVGRLIQHRRLAEVQRVLANGSVESVASLARRFGFSSPQRLARGYRAAYGRAVGEERRSAPASAGDDLTGGTGDCSVGTPPA